MSPMLRLWIAPLCLHVSPAKRLRPSHLPPPPTLHRLSIFVHKAVSAITTVLSIRLRALCRSVPWRAVFVAWGFARCVSSLPHSRLLLLVSPLFFQYRFRLKFPRAVFAGAIGGSVAQVTGCWQVLLSRNELTVSKVTDKKEFLNEGRF